MPGLWLGSQCPIIQCLRPPGIENFHEAQLAQKHAFMLNHLVFFSFENIKLSRKQSHIAVRTETDLVQVPQPLIHHSCTCIILAWQLPHTLLMLFSTCVEHQSSLWSCQCPCYITSTLSHSISFFQIKLPYVCNTTVSLWLATQQGRLQTRGADHHSCRQSSLFWCEPSWCTHNNKYCRDTFWNCEVKWLTPVLLQARTFACNFVFLQPISMSNTVDM